MIPSSKLDYVLAAGSGALIMNDEGNRPDFVEAVLQYILRNTAVAPLDITGFYLDFPQRTVYRSFDSVKVVDHVTKLGTIKALKLDGEVLEWHHNRKDGNKLKKLEGAMELDFIKNNYTKVLAVKSERFERNFLVDRESDAGLDMYQ